MIKITRTIFAMLVAVVLLSAFKADRTITIFMIGDSTMATRISVAENWNVVGE